MKLIEAQTKLLTLNQPVIQTADAAIYLKTSRSTASKILERLAEVDAVFPLARGLWALSRTLDPLILPEYLTAPLPSYVSLQTALYYHGMISQIPSTIYAVSLARTRHYSTPLGDVSIHHLNSNFFFDFCLVGNSRFMIKMATPEKALLDTLYLTPARSLLFKSLPELELPPHFDIKKSFKMIKKIPSQRIRTIVTKKLESILNA